MATSLDIINGALINIGEEPITSINEKKKAGRLVKNRYEIVRREVLRRHPWKCASARAILSPRTTTPAFGRTREFSIPPDVIRIWRVVDVSNIQLLQDVTNEDESWRQETDVIISDFPELGIEYVKDEKNVGRFDPLLVQAMSLRLAVDIGYSLTQDKDLRAQLQSLFVEILGKAKSADAKQEAPRRLEAQKWIQSSRTTFPVPALPGLQ
jgi:hypothetical protein